jgi:hypothetical protein
MINKEDLNKIKAFIKENWKNIKKKGGRDKELCKKLALLFFFLGFEVIPVEVIKDNEKFKSLEQIPHPDIILYDFSLDTIIFIEEESNLDKHQVYKGASIKKVQEIFPPLFQNNEKILFQYLAKKISSRIKNLDKPLNVIPQSKFVKLLSKIFKDSILEKNILEDNDLRNNLGHCIDIIKGITKLEF